MAEGLHTSILLVDDDTAGRNIRKLVLESYGHRVLAVADAEDALLAISREPIGLVILDYFLDGITGAEVAERMHRVKPSVPILMLSGGFDTSEKPEHVDACVSKLDPIPIIEDKITELLYRARGVA